MKIQDLSTFNHEKAIPPAYILKAYDEVNSLLDDQMLQTQAMLASSYMRGKLKTETTTWNIKLDTMQQIIE